MRVCPEEFRHQMPKIGAGPHMPPTRCACANCGGILECQARSCDGCDGAGGVLPGGGLDPGVGGGGGIGGPGGGGIGGLPPGGGPPVNPPGFPGLGLGSSGGSRLHNEMREYAAMLQNMYGYGGV